MNIEPDKVVVLETARKYKTGENVRRLAEDFLTKKGNWLSRIRMWWRGESRIIGQMLPIICRKDGEQLILVAGLIRLEAVKLIRNGFTDSKGKYQKDARFLIKVKLTPAAGV